MDTSVKTLQLPAKVYTELQSLAEAEHSEPAEVIARLVALAQQQRTTLSDPDPVFDLIGAYQSNRSLIDNIPISEDPDLYVAAEHLGAGKHAWEIAPDRYVMGPDGRPVRREAGEATP